MLADITLRPLEHRDINLLREMRNANREAFFDSREITPQAQEQWWKWYSYDREDNELDIYVIILNEVTPVGFVSVTLMGPPLDEIEISSVEIGHVLLAPAYRGQGIMHQAIVKLRDMYLPNTLWIAHVKPDNHASLRVFEKLGFWRVNA